MCIRDRLNQQEFYKLLQEARERGATVFLSSHILSEVEHVCDRVGIVRSGRLVKVAQLEDLRHIRVHRVELEFAPGSSIPEDRLRAAAGVENLVISEGRATCTVRGSFDPFFDAIRESRVTDLVSTEPSLEEIFLSYYSEKAPEALPP